MNKYPKYKPSNIPWLGDVPEHWGLVKIKWLFDERIEKGFPNEPLLAATQNIGVVLKEVYGQRTVEATKDLHMLKLVKVNDFVISLRSFQGGIEISYYQGIISPAYTIMIPKVIAGQYFKHLAKSKPFIELLKQCVTGIREGQNIDYNILKNSHIPVPLLEEQTQIVQYLDDKLQKINKLTETKKKQIDLLKEQKQVMINEAVTKGGEGWVYQRLKTLVNNINEKGSPQNKFYVGMENIVSWTCEYINTGVMAEGDCKKFTSGDVLFGKLRPYLAKIYKPDNEGVCSGEFLVLRGFKGYLPFLKYCLLSYDFIMLVNASTYGAKMPRANWDFIGNCIIPSPPLAEQQKIVTYLDNITAKIDVAIEKIRREISLWEDYRTRLISDVVTGKLDIRKEMYRRTAVRLNQ